jgi:transposase
VTSPVSRLPASSPPSPDSPPHVRNSGERVRLGAISHQGSPHLCWGLIQAAQTAVQADGLLKTFYERIKHRRGSNVAKVAVAREIRTDTLAPIAAE